MKGHEGDICEQCFQGVKSLGLVLKDSYYLGKKPDGSFGLFDLNGHDEILELPFLAKDPCPDSTPEDSPLWNDPRVGNYLEKASAAENSFNVHMETAKALLKASTSCGYQEDEGSWGFWLINYLSDNIPVSEQSNY